MPWTHWPLLSISGHTLAFASYTFGSFFSLHSYLMPHLVSLLTKILQKSSSQLQCFPPSVAGFRKILVTPSHPQLYYYTTVWHIILQKYAAYQYLPLLGEKNAIRSPSNHIPHKSDLIQNNFSQLIDLI